jgi:hypothetical protein
LNTPYLENRKSILGTENIKRNKQKNMDLRSLLNNFEIMKASTSEIDRKISCFFDSNFFQALKKKSKNFDFIFNQLNLNFLEI